MTMWGENARLKRTYYGMKNRCLNEKSPQYKDYGGRGISICDDWSDNPLAFIDWALNNGYDNSKRGYLNSIDRIDNGKGYCPENCRWVPMLIQAENKRPRVFTETDLKRMSEKAKEWHKARKLKDRSAEPA